MAYDEVQYQDVDQLAPGMHFMRDALNCEKLGLTVVDTDDNWQGKEHNHGEEKQEEVYLLVEGSGRIDIEGESIDLQPGSAVRVDPESSRQLSFDESSKMVIVGAP